MKTIKAKRPVPSGHHKTRFIVSTLPTEFQRGQQELDGQRPHHHDQQRHEEQHHHAADGRYVPPIENP
ncbi:MAG: hypothetical protein ACLQAH_18755 [Limisphaerales bacterium]